jgi:pyruvate/2-oxoglutarate dehydrogenase complex dihydrolipoamide acyltransferase (E2) component
MAIVEIKIPQLGEGLQEARLIRFLKQPGETVQQDEPIYEMETDKAVMEIESPTAGILQEWSAQEDDVLPIGATIGQINTDGAPKAGVTPAGTSAQSNGSEMSTVPPATPSTDTGIVEIRIPQLGEGLQEARLVRFIKQPGDAVSQDEPIYEMETDKALMEIESPAAGILDAWTAKEDDVLPIGAVIGRIKTETVASFADDSASLISTAPLGSTEQQAAAHPTTSTQAVTRLASNAAAPLTSGPLRNELVPPRTKAYAAERGVSEAELARLAQSAGHKLLPEDIDLYLTQGHQEAPTKLETRNSKLETYTDSPLPSRQKTLNFRLQRSAQAVVPATMEMPLAWGAIEEVRAAMKASSADKAPTQFLLFAWCVAQAVKNHPRFLTALVNDTTLRQYEHLHLGIAVARPGDELLMARIPNADTLSFAEFIAAAQDAITRARDGQDQTTEAMQLSLTNMASAGVRTGIPVVVAPAVGTLFIGAPYDEAYPLPGGSVGFRRVTNMVFTFDHRIANGVGAARFLADIQKRVEAIQEELGGIK